MACDSPYYVKNPNLGRIGLTEQAEIPVPCGRCPICIRNRVNGWVFRLKQEEKRSSSSYFITLTYDTRTVPITKNGFMSLDRNDLQKFWKRLRKTQKEKIKYYAVGEYGGKTSRPHYHAIVFNIQDVEEINKQWNKGAVHIGTVSGDSIGYTAGYINKGKIIPQHSRDDRKKEFSVMSKKLGDNYLTPEIKKYHSQDVQRNHVTLEGGVKIALPRYYRDRIYNDDQKKEQREAIQKINEEKERADYRKFQKKYGHIHNYTFEYWRDTKKHARFKSFKSFNNNSKRDKI